MVRPSQQKQMAQWAVKDKTLSIRRACRLFEVSETCYRYHAKLSSGSTGQCDMNGWMSTSLNRSLTPSRPRLTGYGDTIRNGPTWPWEASPRNRSCCRQPEATSRCGYKWGDYRHFEFAEKTPFSDEVHQGYTLKNECIQDANYKVDLELRRLRRSLLITHFNNLLIAAFI